MMDFKKIYRVINPDELTKKEKFIHCLFILVTTNIFPTIICILGYLFLKWRIYYILFSSNLIILASLVRVIFYDKITKKFPVESEIKGFPFSSYQFATLSIFYIVPVWLYSF